MNEGTNFTLHGRSFRCVNSARLFNISHGIGVSVGLSILCFLLGLPFSATAQQESGHQVTTLEIPFKRSGVPHTLRFPVYEQNGTRYFSAGLGKEERQLTFPPYPLKLIFVQGERAYLAGVAVEILKGPEESPLLSIPGNEVEGPWLFLNLPTGDYTIKARNSGGIAIKKSVTIPTAETQTLHFRWP